MTEVRVPFGYWAVLGPTEGDLLMVCRAIPAVNNPPCYAEVVTLVFFLNFGAKNYGLPPVLWVLVGLGWQRKVNRTILTNVQVVTPTH